MKYSYLYILIYVLLCITTFFPLSYILKYANCICACKAPFLSFKGSWSNRVTYQLIYEQLQYSVK